MQTQQNRLPQVLLRGTLTCETPVSFSLPLPKNSRLKGKQPTIQTSQGERLYINAPALRSAVRHAATQLVHELTGKPYHMDDYFLAAVGGIKDAGKESGAEDEGDGDDAGEKDKTAQAAAEAGAQRAYTLKFDFAKEKNPLLMLFGSMDVPGLVECSHAIDAAENPCKAQEFHGVRANDFRRSPAVVDMLTPTALDEFLARQTDAALRSGIKKEIKDLDTKARKAEKEGNLALARELKDKRVQLDAEQRGNSVVQLMLPNLGYEAIPPGTKLSHEWALKRVSDIELALFVQSLALWALDPKIGGHRNHGLGRLSGQWTVNVRRPGATRLESFGTLSFKDYDGLQAQGEVARFLDPALLTEAIPSLDFSYASLAALK